MLVPDLIEPFLAWRVWGVTLGSTPGHYASLKLDSLYHNAVWPTEGPLAATCDEGCTESPCDAMEAELHHGERHPCGIYAAKEYRLASLYLPDFLRSRNGMVQKRCTLVIGRVEMFGVVKEHEMGYRAQKARPHDLYVPVCFGAYAYDARRATAVLSENYGVPARMFRRAADLEDL